MNINPIRRIRICSILINCLYDLKEDAKSIFFQHIIRHHPKINMRESVKCKQGLIDLINSISSKASSKLNMVEIGSYRGESAELFLKTGAVSKIYCVDPWKPFYDKTDMASFTNMKKVEQDFDNRFKNDSRVIKVKGTIDDFMPNGTIDLVYIDGCHTQEATQHDIDVTMQRIQPRLAIAGHDYLVDSGVKAAVDNTFSAPDEVFSDTSWIHFIK